MVCQRALLYVVSRGGAFVRTEGLLPSNHLPVFLSVVFHRGPPGSRGPMIPPLLSLPPPPRGRGHIRGGLGPRSSPYGRGWWGVNTEPPFPGPGHGGPSREVFYQEPRNPRRLKSWSLVKNTYPPKDSPQMMEGKAHFVIFVPWPVYQQAWESSPLDSH